MRGCLLREVWTAAGNDPLLPPSPLAELGSLIHKLLGAAGRGELEGGSDDRIKQTWIDIVSLAEERMTLSVMQRHQVPLSRTIPDYEVRRMRAFHRAKEIAGIAVRGAFERPKVGRERTGCEVWVEAHDGQIGGYIDRATKAEDGVVLSDYKSGTVMTSGKAPSSLVVSRHHREQLMLYAALYRFTYGDWPVRLEVVPLHGTAISVQYDVEEADGLLADAMAFLQNANQSIMDVETGRRQIAELASPDSKNCRFCLFRPACPAYWSARPQGSQTRWPADVEGMVKEKTRLRNGKACLRIMQYGQPEQPCITVRNLTDDVARHPLIYAAQPGVKIALYGLEHNVRSNDYEETHNTVLFADEIM